MLPVPDWPNRGDALIGRIGPASGHHRRFVETADPIELAKISLDFGPPNHLVQIVRPADSQDRQSVRFGNVVQVIRSDEAAAPGHVLDDDSGIARNMLAQIATDEACADVCGRSRPT